MGGDSKAYPYLGLNLIVKMMVFVAMVFKRMWDPCNTMIHYKVKINMK